MPEFEAHVLVCCHVTGDDNHCGDKGGPEVRARFNELLQEHDLLNRVVVSNTGCTSQHRFCEKEQCSITVYGPGKTGGTWYIVTPSDVEDIVLNHLVKQSPVEQLKNPRISAKFE